MILDTGALVVEGINSLRVPFPSPSTTVNWGNSSHVTTTPWIAFFTLLLVNSELHERQGLYCLSVAVVAQIRLL